MDFFTSLFGAWGDDSPSDASPEDDGQKHKSSGFQRKHFSTDLSQLRRVELLFDPTVGDFGLLQVLGVGQSGKVVLARRNNQIARQFALRMMRKSDVIAKKQVARVNTERRVLEMIDSPFITRLHYSFQVGTIARPSPPRPARVFWPGPSSSLVLVRRGSSEDFPTAHAPAVASASRCCCCCSTRMLRRANDRLARVP